MSHKAAKSLLQSTKRILRRFARETSGVGAVEFALLAPLLLMLYITSFELTQGLSASKRTARAAGVIADLVSQEDAVTPATLSTMASVAQSIYAPFDAANARIVVTGIAVDSKGAGTVEWSWTNDGSSPDEKGSAVTVPEALYRTGASISPKLSVDLTQKNDDGTTTVVGVRQIYSDGTVRTVDAGSPEATSSGSSIATIDQSFFIRAQVSYPFKLLRFMPGLLPSEIQDLTLQREYFFRQRTNEKLPCNGCDGGTAS